VLANISNDPTLKSLEYAELTRKFVCIQHDLMEQEVFMVDSYIGTEIFKIKTMMINV
jgi:hypothetical protein